MPQEKTVTTKADDIFFARELHNKTVMHWQDIWPRINELHRAGLVRVKPVNLYWAEIEAIGEAKP